MIGVLSVFDRGLMRAVQMSDRAKTIATFVGILLVFACVVIGTGVWQAASARAQLRQIAGNPTLEVTSIWNAGSCGTFQMSKSDAQRPFDLQDHPFLAGVLPTVTDAHARPELAQSEARRWASCMAKSGRGDLAGKLLFPVAVALVRLS